MRVFFVFLLLISSSYVSAEYGDALKTLQGSTGDAFLNDMGISGAGVGNIGKGKGGAKITQVRTGTIPCSEEFEDYSYRSINSVSFSCVKNPSGYSISYCDKGVYGSSCLTGSDYKLISGSSVNVRDVSISVGSCSDSKCPVTVKLSRTQHLDGDALDDVGQKSLQEQYDDNDSIVSITMGAGVYDQEGNVIVAGKNPNSGKMHETILNKDDAIDCAQRQANELDKGGETGTCAQPEIPVKVFDRDGDLSCEDVKECISSVTQERVESKSCFISAGFDGIMQNSKTRHEACINRETYNCTHSKKWTAGCNSSQGEYDKQTGMCKKRTSCASGTLLSHTKTPRKDEFRVYCHGADQIRIGRNRSNSHQIFSISPFGNISKTTLFSTTDFTYDCNTSWSYSQHCDESYCYGTWHWWAADPRWCANPYPYSVKAPRFPIPISTTTPSLVEVSRHNSCLK